MGVNNMKDIIFCLFMTVMTLLLLQHWITVGSTVWATVALLGTVIWIVNTIGTVTFK
jgi:hypothetical protein